MWLIIRHIVGRYKAKLKTPHSTPYCHMIMHIMHNQPHIHKPSWWFKVLTLARFADSNLSEHFCLYFCSTAKWDVLKATGWWVECMGMSVHIRLRYQPCPHSVTIIVVKPFRLDQAAIRPEEKSLHGQRYGLEVGMFSFCLSLSCRHPPTAEQLFRSFSSRWKSGQRLPIGSISPDPVSLDKTTFAFSIFTQNNTRSEHHQSLSCAKFWRCCSF